MTEERRDMTLVKNQLLLQDIKRWHIVPTVVQQTVADHTYGVMVIALKLCSFLPRGCPVDPYAVLLEAMSHDMGEVGFGDVPSRERDTADEDAVLEWIKLNITQRIVKLADMLEMSFTLERIAPTARGKAISTHFQKRCLQLLKEGLFDKAHLDDAFQRQRMNNTIRGGVEAMIAEEWDWRVGV